MTAPGLVLRLLLPRLECGTDGSSRRTAVKIAAQPTLSPAVVSPHSHSIVPGGFEVMSYTTRLTPFTSLMMRVATWPMNFMSNG
jgi:hypothetical protein